jgi:predicted nucleic-acid-binding Zn-ribbon protein
MYKLILKKKSRTKTVNNRYNILLKKNINSFPIGSYNQDSGIFSIDIERYIVIISKGCNFSENFKKLFLRSTRVLSIKQKNILKF